MNLPEPDYSQWSWQHLVDGLSEMQKLVLETDARGEPVGELLDEGDRIAKAMDKLVKMKYPVGSPQYEEWWRIRQVEGEPPHVPERFGPRWSQ